MSEKLYKVIEAVDLFDENSPIPERYLVFMAEGNQIKEFFPENRKTIVFNGKVYDWYGREAETDSNISKVIGHFGIVHDEYQEYETFTVQRRDNRLALATLYHVKEHGETGYYELSRISEKDRALFIDGWRMHRKPLLICEEWSFASFCEPPTSPNCLDELNKWLQNDFGFACKICVDITMDKGQFIGTRFIRTYDWIGIYPGLFTHAIVPIGRRAIFKHYTCDTPIYGPIIESFCDRILFSEDGRKMTAFTKINDEKHRISTDMEVIRYTYSNAYRDVRSQTFVDSNLFWYYDKL